MTLSYKHLSRVTEKNHIKISEFTPSEYDARGLTNYDRQSIKGSKLYD